MKKRAHLMTPGIRELLKKKHYSEIREVLKELLPPDVAEIIQSLSQQEVLELLKLIPRDKIIEVFVYLPEESQISLLQDLDPEGLKNLLNEMPSDERADLFLRISPLLKERLLAIMSEEEKKDVEKLIRYKENTAGALMTTEFAQVAPDATVEESVQHLRKTAPKRETIYYIYVTDENNNLLGVLSLKDLILAPGQKKIREIMKDKVIKVNLADDQEEVATIFKKYDLLAIPVVDESNKIYGIITFDDIVDVIEKEDTEDFQRMAAIETIENEYLKAPFLLVARKRIVWLLLLLFTYTISTQLLKHYSYALESVIALAYFIPMLSGSAGNAGTQSATLITRGLATGEIEFKQIFKIMRREILMGISLGILLGSLGYMRAYFLQGNPLLGVTIGTALALVITIATFTGSLLPLFLYKVGIDPAISAGPFLTTILDITSILIYFQVAKFLLGLID